MGRSTGRAKDRVGGRAVAGVLRDARAIVLRADGGSWGELAGELGYRSRSGAERAVARGLDRSGLAAGLRVVMAERLDRLWPRVDALDPVVVAGEAEALGEALMQIYMLQLTLTDLTRGTRPAGVRDVAGLVAVRDPHLPAVDEERRAELFQLRQFEATLDMMHLGYANRSGVHKALERELRRVLLEAAAYYYANPLDALRTIWHEIECALRRRPVEGAVILAEVERLAVVLEDLNVVAAPEGHGVLQNSVSSGPGYPADDAEFPVRDTPYPFGNTIRDAHAKPSQSSRLYRNPFPI
jgi:hypothetical protein